MARRPNAEAVQVLKSQIIARGIKGFAKSATSTVPRLRRTK
jgi:hypothetical protein